MDPRSISPRPPIPISHIATAKTASHASARRRAAAVIAIVIAATNRGLLSSAPPPPRPSLLLRLGRGHSQAPRLRAPLAARGLMSTIVRRTRGSS